MTTGPHDTRRALAAIGIALLSALFFTMTYVLNRVSASNGGHWAWIAALRYLITLPLLLPLMKAGGAGWSDDTIASPPTPEAPQPGTVTATGPAAGILSMPLRPPLPTYGFGTPTLTDSRPATRSTVRSPHGTSTRIAAGTQVVVTGSTPMGSPSAYAGRSGASSVTDAA
mgnify:CR=1 FL=1